MAKIVKTRRSSGVHLATVSYSIDWEQKRQKYGISKSDAMKRGLKFFFDEIENKTPADALPRKVEQLTNVIENQARQVEELEKSLTMYKKLRGEL